MTHVPPHHNPPRHRFPMFTASRYRKAALMDGLAVALLLATMVFLGAAVYFASAPR